MLFLPEFPWSDLHTLNLDWLLSVVASHERQLQDIEGSASPYDEAPLADGVADPGTVNQFSRGDHRHPTDTTRASVAALQAVQDTVPGPSNGSPRMDGTANPGTYTYYSRADHVHPSDTSKLDKTGGEVNGTLDILPRRCYGMLNSPGWYRVLSYSTNNIDRPKGNPSFAIDITITKNSTSRGSETHKITLLARWNTTANGLSFVDESSSVYSMVVDKIRYNLNGVNGYVDIHFTANDVSFIYVDFNVHCDPTLQSAFTAESLQSVAPSPIGETVVKEYTFVAITGMRVVHAQSSTSFGDAIATIKDIIGDDDITWAGNAANNLHAGISNFSNGVISVASSGGPNFFATLGKYTANYYAAELFNYNNPWRLRIRNINGTYYAELYYPNY